MFDTLSEPPLPPLQGQAGLHPESLRGSSLHRLGLPAPPKALPRREFTAPPLASGEASRMRYHDDVRLSSQSLLLERRID